MKSKVLRLLGPRDIKLENQTIDKKEILARTIYSAISPGTELAAYSGAHQLRAGTSYPRLLGYCNVSEVISVDPDVEIKKKGDHIVTLQSHRDIFSIDAHEVLSIVPKGVSLKDAACSYLFHLGYAAAINLNILQGLNIAVFGGGCLGLSTAIMQSFSARSVTIFSDIKLENLQSQQEKKIFNMARRKDLDGSKYKDFFDIAIVTTNSFEDLQHCLRCLKDRGKIGILGFPGRDGQAIDFNPFQSDYFYVKQLTYQAIGLLPESSDDRSFLRFNEHANINFILDLFKQKKISHKVFSPKTYHYTNLDKCYDDLHSRISSAKTHLIKWQ